MRPWFLIFIMLALLSACSPSLIPPDTSIANTPGDQRTPFPADANPYAPQPGDISLLRGTVYLDSAQLLIKESYPPQISLVMMGNLPDPCHTLRVNVSTQDAENRIRVDVYSLTDSSTICVQVLEPFNVSIPLGDFPAGHYTVLVNGDMAGEFDY